MLRHLTASLVAGLVLCGSATAAPHEFADWSSRTNLTTNGTLQGRNVVLTSPEVVGGNVFNGTSTQFSDASIFTPAIAFGDQIEIVGRNGDSYTLDFGGPTKDPVFHLYSLASTIAFSEGPSVTKVSGESTFTTSANSVSGQADGSADSSGTIRVNGTFSSLTFTATPTFGDGSQADGISLQVGVRLAVPPPTTTIALFGDPPPGGYFAYLANVTVLATGDPDGAPRETRCVLDPPSAPASFDALPTGCSYGPSTEYFSRFVGGVGNHTLYAASRNATGETESVVSRTFRVESPPETVITGAPQGSIWNPTPQFTFSGGATYECRMDGAAFAPCASPFTAPVLASGPHAFQVRAINARGIGDPTPAGVDFAVNQPDHKRLACNAKPIFVGIFMQSARLPDLHGCMIGTLGSQGCSDLARCVIRDERCPRGARCTLKTRVQWFDADLDFNWLARAYSAYGPIAWDTFGVLYPVSRGPDSSENCATGFDRDRCSTITPASLTWLGEDQPIFASCTVSLEPGSGHLSSVGRIARTIFRDDDVRRIECDAELKIEPARPYVPVLPIIIPGFLTTQVGAPGAGTMSLAASILTSSGKASVAAKRKAAKPKIATQTKKVAKAGPIKFRLKLNATAKALLKRKRKLRVRLTTMFKPAGGGPSVKRTLITSIKQPKPRATRCTGRKSNC